MTAVFLDADLAKEAPQLHVLLIGVSEYPYLPDGRSFDARHPPKRAFGLGQLSSPHLSASSLADWFLTTHDNPDAPLGSVEMLLSPAAYRPNDVAATRLGVAPGSAVPVSLATFDALQVAAVQWYDRLNASRDNIGLFYFCGHGLEASDRYLLAADFAADPDNLDHGIVNFQQTFRNMSRCRAATQCFLLDACRDSPDQLRIAAAEGKVGRPIIDPRSGPTLGRNAPIYHAAAAGKPAFGPAGQKSFFARALIDCLNGLAARAGGDPTFFSIDHASLALALPEYVNRLDQEYDLGLQCLTDGGDAQLPNVPELHRAPQPVDVLTTIFCRPRDADAVAQLTVTDAAGKITPRPDDGQKPWRVTLKSGKHLVSATFAAGAPFTERHADISVVPTPLFSIPLPVSPRPPVDAGGSMPR